MPQPDSKLNRPISWRMAVPVILLCTIVFVAGPLYALRALDRSIQNHLADPRELVPQSGVNRWGFNLSPLLVDRDDLQFFGSPKKDDIAALNSPRFVPAAEAGLDAEEHVIGVSLRGQSRAWPLSILNWHCVVNDTIASEPLTILYSGMAGTAAAFSRTIGGETLEFGVSGLMHMANLVLFDRRADPNDESLWSVAQMRAIGGPAAASARRFESIDCDVLPWGEWVKMHPDTTVMARHTNYRLDYESSFLYLPDEPVYETPDEGRFFELATAKSKQQVKASRMDLNRRSPVVMVIGPKTKKGYPFADVLKSRDGVRDSIDGIDLLLHQSGGKLPGIAMETTGSLKRVYLRWYLYTAIE